MRHKTKTIIESKWLKLVSSTNPTTGRKHYIVKLVSLPRTGLPYSVQGEIRTLFDPGKNRGSATGNSWKFRNRDEAEKLVTMALLTWGE
jgi:hypothetical protein